MADTPTGPRGGSSPWVNSNGIPAHPDSPIGGGGQGYFTAGGGTLGLSGNDAEALPHPLSPLGRNRVVDQADINRLHESGVALDTNVKVTGGPPPPNPPPATATGTFNGAKRSTAFEEIEIKIEVLADVLNSSEVAANGAGLKVGWKGADIQLPQVLTDAKGKVTAYAGPNDQPDPAGKMRYQRTVTLQIHYGAGTARDAYSAYGRGTTEADKTAKNTSIGFHENCHLEAALAYFKDSARLPAAFTGRIGQSGTLFVKAQETWVAGFDTYLSAEKAASEATVDEVGNPTLSTYRKTNPGHVH